MCLLLFLYYFWIVEKQYEADQLRKIKNKNLWKVGSKGYFWPSTWWDTRFHNIAHFRYRRWPLILPQYSFSVFFFKNGQKNHIFAIWCRLKCMNIMIITYFCYNGVQYPAWCQYSRTIPFYSCCLPPTRISSSSLQFFHVPAVSSGRYSPREERARERRGSRWPDWQK